VIIILILAPARNFDRYKERPTVFFQVPVSKSAQGVTGLESTRLVPDDRLEAAAKDGDDDDDNEEEGSSDADSDDSDFVPYKVLFLARGQH